VLTPRDCSLDHIVPRSQGGDHSMENVQLVCKEANRMKGALTMADFIELCRLVIEVHDAKRDASTEGQAPAPYQRIS